MYKSAIITVLFFSVAGCRQKPQTYADCILQHVKSGQAKEAVVLIHRACEQKFPKIIEEKKVNYFDQFDDPPPTKEYILEEVDFDPFENSRLNEDGSPK